MNEKVYRKRIPDGVWKANGITGSVVKTMFKIPKRRTIASYERELERHRRTEPR
jgi:hypothetical protein